MPAMPGRATKAGGGKPEAAPAYRIKITLRDIEPPIWRRIIVPSRWTLHELHEAIQVAMGWLNCHLYEFEAGGTRYINPEDDEPDMITGWKDATRTRLHKVARVGSRLIYSYDFGDGWEHDVVVEAAEQTNVVPLWAECLEGARSCPPEDCGGPWGYEELLQKLADPSDPEHEELREWVGADFDPEAFDLELVNELLAASRILTGRGDEVP
jgi:hypothetical protein